MKKVERKGREERGGGVEGLLIRFWDGKRMEMEHVEGKGERKDRGGRRKGKEGRKKLALRIKNSFPRPWFNAAEINTYLSPTGACGDC